eukprot:scaffold134820_cov57-Cyclotella_meneghiniana.AAC.1
MNHSRYCNNIGSISSYCNNLRDHHHPIVRRTVPNILDEPNLYQIEEMYARPSQVLIMLNHDVDGRWIVKTQDVDNNANQHHQVQENHDNDDATLLQGANHQESLPREDDQENNETVQAVQQPSTALL